MIATAPVNSNYCLLGSLWSQVHKATSYTTTALTSYFAEKEVSLADHVIPFMNSRPKGLQAKSPVVFYRDKNNQRVVQKVMPRKLAAREMRALTYTQGLPHVVYGISKTNGEHAHILMEDCGMDLSELMKSLGKGCGRKPLPEHLFRSISQQFLAGLAELHTKGLIHNDIKPDNIAVNEQGKVKLIDLGECMTIREAQGHPHYTSTAGYLAPECFETPAQPSKASDVFASAVTLYELLTGKDFIPYPSAEEAMEYNRQICSSEASLNEHIEQSLAASTIAPDYQQLIASMLSFNPEERPTAQAVLSKLEQLHS